MKCLKFKLETPYLVNFRKPFSTITLLSYPFPPYTTIRGLLANALGLERDDYNLQDRFEISLKPLTTPERTQDIVLMKKLKSNLRSKEKTIIKKLDDNKGDLSVLSSEESEIYEGLKYIRSTSAPFVKEFITPISCNIYILGEESEINDLKKAIENPFRPLYIGASDDFVIASDLKIVDATETKHVEIDSIIRINERTQPIDKKRIIGRVPYKFEAINVTKRDYARQDVVVAAPKPNTKLSLNEPVRCFEIEGDYVAF